MRKFRLKPWMIVSAVILLLTVSFFTTFFATNRSGTGLEGAAGSVLTPAISGANKATGSVKEFLLRLFALRNIDKEYQELKSRVALLELENQFMADLQRENENLTKLLGFEKKYPNYSYLPARVIGKDPGAWFFNVTLDRGSNNGVKEDMNVVNEDGLVGRVIEVGPNWCKVMTVIDRQSAVSAVLERSKDNGMVKGATDPQSADPRCGIYHLPNDSEVIPGDKVVTSDLGGFFYKGLPIGSVTSVSRDQNMQRFAVLTPAVDFARLENVLIITSDLQMVTEAQIEQDRKDANDAKNQEIAP